MKKVEAIIESFKVHDVKDALARVGINQMTVSKVRKADGHSGLRNYCRGGRYEPAFLVDKKIEFEVTEEALEKVLAAIELNMKNPACSNERVSVYTLDYTMSVGKRAGSMPIG
jgi:nitrogen regulatory protein PII